MVVKLPPKVIVLIPLLTPVPPYCGCTVVALQVPVVTLPTLTKADAVVRLGWLALDEFSVPNNTAPELPMVPACTVLAIMVPFDVKAAVVVRADAVNVVNAPVLGTALPIGVLLIELKLAGSPILAIGLPLSVALAAVMATLPLMLSAVRVPSPVTFGWLAVNSVPVYPPDALIPAARIVVASTRSAVTLPAIFPLNELVAKTVGEVI